MLYFTPAVRTILISLFFLTFSLATVNTVHAQEKHTVSSGETLFGISRIYNVNVDDIKNWNAMRGNGISVGQVLIVSNPDSSFRTGDNHVVEPGETLFSISRKFEIDVNALRQLNNLSGDNLAVGQTLIVSGDTASGGRSPESAPESGNGATPPTRPSQDYHEVAPGETLYRISRQYEMSVAELQSLNNLRNTQLDIGQRLIVNASRPDVSAGRADTPPQPVHVDASAPMGTFAVHALGDHETVEGLLNSHRMDEEEFIRLNPQTDINDIKAGDEVYVLKPAASDKKNPYRVKSNLETAGDISVTVYDPQHQGNSTTSGDLYNPGNLTAAHSSLRLGKVIYIENPANGKGIFVQINDRVTGNFLKLSSSAFTALGYEGNEPLAARIYEELPE